MTEAVFPALSIRQPWADLILWGVQDVENRRWRSSFRGNVLVHAGRSVDRSGVAAAERRFGVVLPPDYRPRRGAILGMVEIAGCVGDHPSRFFLGPWGFLLRNPVDFDEPIPFPGRLGFFPVPRRLLEGTPAAGAMPGRRPSAQAPEGSG